MTALVTSWRVPDAPVVTGWRGPDDSLQSLAQKVPPRAIACVVGLPGVGGGDALFSELSARNVPAPVMSIITTGYSQLGIGQGIYVCDQIADAALAAAHPLFCVKTANDRYFRLAPFPEGIVAEQCGIEGADTEAAAKLIDNRAKFNAAFAYGIGVGCKTLLLTKPHYAFWNEEPNNPRYPTSSNDADPDDLSGLGLLIDGGHFTIRSLLYRSSIWRMAPNGGDPDDWANWNVIDTYNNSNVLNTKGWRGGGIFLVGPDVAPADRSQRSAVTLHRINLEGGIPYLKVPDNQMNDETGTGWDTSDKAIWCHNDRYTGDIELIDSTLRGFRGEMIYTTGGPENVVRIRNSVIAETNGQLINSNGYTVDVDGLYGYNAEVTYEGVTGKNGKLINTYFENCGGGSLMGGGGVTGDHTNIYNPVRITADEPPYFMLDVTLRNCGVFYPGSWARGRITVIDGRVSLAVGGLFKDGIIDVNLDSITCITDQETNAGVDLIGGNGTGSLSQGLRDIYIDKIVFQQTNEARMAGRLPGTSMSIYNEIGPRVVVGDIVGEVGANPGVPDNALQPTTYRPAFLNVNIGNSTSWSGATQNIETEPDLDITGPRMRLTTTSSGAVAFRFPTAYRQRGEVISLTGGGAGIPYVDGNTSSGSGFRNNNKSIYLPSGHSALFRFDGTYWQLVSGGVETLRANATVDVPSIAAGETHSFTVALPGILVGDTVQSSFSVTLGGLIKSECVNAADAVTITLFNPTASPINPASAVVRVRGSRK